MTSSTPDTLSAILGALSGGLPLLLTQFVACAALLAISVTIYITLTPFKEREMVARGNPAAGMVLAG